MHKYVDFIRNDRWKHCILSEYEIKFRERGNILSGHIVEFQLPQKSALEKYGIVCIIKIGIVCINARSFPVLLGLHRNIAEIK